MMLSSFYEKKVAATKIDLIQHLYNLQIKELNSIHTHLNGYESINSPISTQEMMTIEEELKAFLLMCSLPPSWESFVTTVCNALIVVIKYSEVMSSILSVDFGSSTSITCLYEFLDELSWLRLAISSVAD